MNGPEHEFGGAGDGESSSVGGGGVPSGEGSERDVGSFQMPPSQSAESSVPLEGSALSSKGIAPRRLHALGAMLVALLLVATSAAGAVIGHELWTGTTTAPTAAPASGSAGLGDPFAGQLPSGGFGNGFGGQSSSGGSSGNVAAASGSPADIASVAAKVDPGLVDINTSLSYQSAEGAGTGLVVSSNGEVLTNNHVIEGATKITATDIGNGKTYTATVVGYDPSNDIAVLQLKGASGLKTVTVGDSAKTAVGQAVVGIGNAGGAGGTPSSVGGSVTALNQAITAAEDISGASERLSGLIETNADIQPGDSGGSLVNSSGQVIGIDTAGSEGFAFEPLQNSATQAYAIPINQALAIAKQIESGQGSTTSHIGATAFIGIGVEPTASAAGRGFGGFGGFGGAGSAAPGGSAGTGVAISGVIASDPAAKAGLAAGDLVTSLDGHSVQSATELSTLLLAYHPGNTVTIGWTDTTEQTHTTKITLTSGPPA